MTLPPEPYCFVGEPHYPEENIVNPLTALPTKARKIIYVTYATLGIAFGATQVGYATAQADQPQWLLVAFGVFAYLGTALGLVAAANTQPVNNAHVAELQRLLDDRSEIARAVGEAVNKATAQATRRSAQLPPAT